MVARHIERRGVRDPGVLAAMATVPRERFVRPADRHLAYADRALPIEAGQTISQPYVVAIMTEALELRPEDRVLEIGTGSGYAAAVLGEIAAHVVTVERIAELAELATSRLHALGYANVEVHHGDGTLGWPPGAPYDAIVVTAAGPEVPPALLGQLADGGRLVMPTGRSRWEQRLLRLRRRGDTFDREDLGGVVFVPLIGEQGW